MGPRAHDGATIAFGHDRSPAVNPVVNSHPIRMDRSDPAIGMTVYLGHPAPSEGNVLGGVPAYHRVPATELLIPATELLVPLTELLIPATELLVPLTELLIPATELLIPATELLIPATELLIPATDLLVTLTDSRSHITT